MADHNSVDSTAMPALLRGGDSRALASFVGKYSDVVRRVAGAVLSNPSDVEDVVQEVFIRAISAMHRYNPDLASLATWLSRIAYRVALNAERDGRRHRHVSIDSLAVEPGDDDSDDRVPHDEVMLGRAIDTLDEEDRALLHMYYYEDMALADIAYVTGRNPRTLATRLFRLRARLSEIINKLRTQ